MQKLPALFLTDRDIAARFSISRNSVWRLVKTGQLPAPIKLFAGSTRWKLSELEAFEAARAAESRQAW